MTVLPDAPTDPATGLPVPTIAVATNVGVSVIRDDGTVVDSLHTYIISNCAFNNEGLFYAKDGGTASFNFASFADIAGGDGFGDEIAGQTVGSKDFDILTRPTELALLGETISVGGRVEGTGVVNGVALHAPDHTDFTKGMSALTTSSYTTGWMPGDIKLAALADTTAETLSGSELVVDGSGNNWVGDFDAAADLNSWTAQNSATASVVGGELEVAWNASNSQMRYTLQGLADGTYVVSVDAYRGTADSYDIRIGDNVASTTYGAALTQTNTASTTHVFYANVSNGLLYIFLRPNSFTVGDTAYFDNISVRLADPDRSVNGKGLGVHGSITKTAVATGADVVAYSGFSSSNYLEQPYNSALNFGTGDFCVMGWIKTSAVGTDYIVDTRDGTNTEGFVAFLDGSGTFSLQTKASATASTVYGATNIANGVWHHVVGVVSNIGKTISLYVDGSLDNSGSVTARSIGGLNDVTVIGAGFDKSGSFAGSLALLRISATAPTADQIAKIYNDERPLFQPNAKATLTGSSDAVTALAHDPDTNLLHVGTSGGRSVFQGLRRVEEHTGTDSQSLAAISAVDGLVVEGK